MRDIIINVTEPEMIEKETIQIIRDTLGGGGPGPGPGPGPGGGCTGWEGSQSFVEHQKLYFYYIISWIYLRLLIRLARGPN